MNLLLLPNPVGTEGPSSYQMRVAEANQLPYKYVAEECIGPIDDDVESSVIFQRWRALKNGPAIWVNRRARWCPICLAQHGRGRIGWELLFADACAGCGHWLLDACSTCGDPVTWRRDALARCACGANLCEQPSRMAPSAVVKLSRAMERLALGVPDGELPHLRGLSIAQCSRLVRVLGAYGSERHQRSPQKIVGADTLDVSWTISSVAGEILSNWPSAFHTFLMRQSGSDSATNGRMPGVFGGFYRALYAGLKEPAFDWVREAFEDFIAENWTGAIGRRNRRMPASVLKRMAWLPAPDAAAQLGVSLKRLAFLIESGRVISRSRVTSTGRTFVMVRRADVQALVEDVSSDISLAEASAMLGIKRQRLGRLLPHICPNAKKVTLQGTPWFVPRGWINGWLERIAHLPVIRAILVQQVSLDSLLRYGPLGEEQIANLLLDVSSGRIKPVGWYEAGKGLAGLVFDRQQLSDTNYTPTANGLNIPEAADRLGVKQEVAYALVRLGLLNADQQRLGRRNAAYVSDHAIRRFRQSYVFAVELSKMSNRSPKALIEALAAEGVVPVAGPALGNCRQAVFDRQQLAAVQWCDALFTHAAGSNEDA